MTFDLRIADDLEGLSREAAAEVVRLVRSAVSRRGRCRLALAGGSTPRPLYTCLARTHVDAIPWGRVHLFWGDERCVPWDDPRSNYRMAHETLLAHVPVPPENVHPMPVGHGQPEEAATTYESTLRRFFQDAWPRFDLVLLGVGADGHTASLFPDSPALEERRRWVAAVRAPVEPAQRLTLTLPVLNHAAHVFFLAAGEDKARAVQCALEQPADFHECPAGAVRPIGGQTVWWLDEAAAAGLTPPNGR